MFILELPAPVLFFKPFTPGLFAGMSLIFSFFVNKQPSQYIKVYCKFANNNRDLI